MSEESILLEDITNEQNIASRYIVDVSIAPTYIMLGDSSRMKFYINKKNDSCIEQFKKWFNHVFSLGTAGKLTLFEYKKVEHEGEVVNIIEKFLPSSLIPISQTLQTATTNN